MRFYTKQHQYCCGIVLHTKNMYICILNQEGNILVHQNIKTEPKSWSFSEEALLLLRENEDVKKYDQKLKSKHGKSKALAIIAHRVGRTVYFMLKNKQAFEVERFLMCLAADL